MLGYPTLLTIPNSTPNKPDDHHNSAPEQKWPLSNKYLDPSLTKMGRFVLYIQNIPTVTVTALGKTVRHLWTTLMPIKVMKHPHPPTSNGHPSEYLNMEYGHRKIYWVPRVDTLYLYISNIYYFQKYQIFNIYIYLNFRNMCFMYKIQKISIL